MTNKSDFDDRIFKKIIIVTVSFLSIYILSFIGALTFESENIVIRFARLLTLLTYLILFFIIYKRKNKWVIILMALLIFLSGANVIAVTTVGIYTTALENYGLKLFYLLLGGYFIFSAVWLTFLSLRKNKRAIGG